MHAYLIAAHNDFKLLETLIQLLDDERNDIYLHIDKKVKNFDFNYFKSIPQKSNIFFVRRYNIQWGGYNIIKMELALFHAAYTNHYEYYHLLSGSDLPIKSQDSIHNFFELNKGYEFIDCASSQKLAYYKREDRFQYYHLFNNIGIQKRGIGRLNKICLSIQKKLHVDRYKNKWSYGFGSQWVSLSHKGVASLLTNEAWIKKHFSYTHCCDEIYKQTVLQNSHAKIYPYTNANMRYIVWSEDDSSHHPHTFDENDYDKLKNSIFLFARKFSSAVDRHIIDSIYNQLTLNKQL